MMLAMFVFYVNCRVENCFEMVKFICYFVSLCVLCLILRGFIGLREFVGF